MTDGTEFMELPKYGIHNQTLLNMKQLMFGPNQGWRSRGPASVSRPASRPNFDGLGLGLGLGCSCLSLGLGLGGPGFVYRVSRTGLGLEAGLET